MRYLILLTVTTLWFSIPGQAQKEHGAVKVTYHQIVNGQEVRRGPGITLLAGREVSETRSGRTAEGNGRLALEEREVLDLPINRPTNWRWHKTGKAAPGAVKAAFTSKALSAISPSSL